MHAANHAITALAVKKVIPEAPLVPLLLSVQAAELLWVGFHYLEVEWTTIDTPFNSVADVHFVHMPWSHSILGAAVLALLFAAMGAVLCKKWDVALALFLGAASHVAIDLLIHAPDIAVAPLVDLPRYGLGPYGNAPVLAFAIEIAYGLVIWRFVGGGKGLLALMVLFNAAALTSYIPSLHGSEAALAGEPMKMVAFVFIQIAATLPLVYILAPRWMRSSRLAAEATSRALP